MSLLVSRAQRALLALAVTLLAGCSTLVATPAAPEATPEVALQAWSRVLERFVDERGEVDFAALARDRDDLDRYVRHIADQPIEQLPDGPQRLAHMINAYNALSMFNVIERGIPASHVGTAKISFFVLRKLRIGGRELSLYAFENEVIRPYARARQDPRIHFALNCSALACPVLPRRPFTAAALDAELERETRAFFALPGNFRIDAATQTLWLSEILNFYPEDFVPMPAPSLLAYANRYAPQPAPADFRVRFTPYDWTVANSRRQQVAP
jgi:hypothetical protein